MRPVMVMRSMMVMRLGLRIVTMTRQGMRTMKMRTGMRPGLRTGMRIFV